MKKLFYSAAVAAMALVACSQPEVSTYVEAEDPVAISDEQLAAWDEVGKLEGAWASADSLYSRSVVPAPASVDVCALEGWRGEKLSAMFLLYTGSGADNVVCKVKDFRSADAVLPSDIAKAQFVRYTLADEGHEECRCHRSLLNPTILVPDMIDNLPYFNMEAKTARPVWVTINIPQDAAPGVYRSEVVVSANGARKLHLPVEVEVIGQTLPSYTDWKFHLDLWQHPSAVARMENLEVWSDEHFEALKKQMLPLAQAGQKVITTTLNMDPWGFQCFDDYEDMIVWIRHDEDTWSFDYTVFDRWVELMMSLGVNKQINCYSMLPWNNFLRYLDVNTNAMVRRKVAPGSERFEKYWGAFLTDFKKHLSEKGWLGITNIAVDERNPEDMDEANRVLTKYAPEIGFAMADNHASYRRYMNIKDCCVAQRQLYLTKEDLAQRRANGYVTTFYVCCSTYFPNNFTYSQPFESELLAWHAIAKDYDGMLRWAYNSWPHRPEYDSRFRNWGSGDTYMIGSDARSTLRFERTYNGIEAYEKVHILRKLAADKPEVIQPLEDKLREFDSYELRDNKLPWSTILSELNDVLNSVSKELL